MHTCSSCSKSFKFQSGLSRHMDIHKPNSRICCTCGTLFTRADNLNIHQLKCSATNNQTSDDEGLNVHSNMEPDTSKSLDLIETNTTSIVNVNTEYNNQIKDVVTSKHQSDTSVLVFKNLIPSVLEIKKILWQ